MSQPTSQFVLIFRLGQRVLTDPELQQRDQEIRTWAKGINAAGHDLRPHTLDPPAHWCGPDGDTATAPAASGAPLRALLFVQARDLPQAVELARTHPGVRYGASVEVRPWTNPGAATAQP